MALPIPRLDDLSYADLVQEAVALLPALAPEWTNHNPSDPGITLLELLAWRAEMLVYRADQVPPEHVLAFLRLLRGPGWTPDAALAADPARLAAEVRETVAGLRTRWRAVTVDDYEQLSTVDFNAWKDALAAHEPCWRAWASGRPATGQAPEGVCAACAADGGREPLGAWWAALGAGPRDRTEDALPSALPRVARARCVPRADLSLPGPVRDREGHLTVVAVPELPAGGLPPAPAVTERLCRALWGFLDERRLVGTWHHVVPPVWVPVRVQALVALRADVPDRAAAESMLLAAPADRADEIERVWGNLPGLDAAEGLRDALVRYLDPVRGGPDGEGWEMGRSVYLSEMFERLERMEAVEWVPYLELGGEWLPPEDGGLPRPRDPEEAAAYALPDETWNPDGDMIGVRLSQRQLPIPQVRAADLHTSDAILPVGVAVALARDPAEYGGPVLGALRRAARRAFPPFGPAAAGMPPHVPLSAVRQALDDALRRAGLDPAAELRGVEVRAAEDRLLREPTGRAVGVRLRPREAAHVRTALAGPEAEEVR